jgi:hypothetical protein
MPAVQPRSLRAAHGDHRNPRKPGYLTGSLGVPGGSKPAARDGGASLATEVANKAAGDPPKEPSGTP